MTDKPKDDDRLSKIEEFLRKLELVDRISLRLIDYLLIAQEEVQRATEMHPESADRIKYNLGVTMPPPVMIAVNTKVYRHHVRELLQRIVDGEDTRPATDAELLANLTVLQSITPPLNLKATRLFIHLGQKLGFLSDHPHDSILNELSEKELADFEAHYLESRMNLMVRNRTCVEPPSE